MPNTAKPSRIGSRSSSSVSRIVQATSRRRLNDEPPLRRRLALACPDCSAAAAGSAASRRAPRARRLFEVADERVLERGGAARRDQARRRIGRQHAPRIHQRNAVAALGLVHEMGRDEDRHALIARQIDQQFPEPVARQRIDARGRLVEDQHLGFVDDRDRERQPLADAERQILGALVEMIGKAEAPDQFGDARLAPCAPAGGTGARADRGSAGPSARYRARRTATCSRRGCARPGRSHRAAGRTAAPRPRWPAAARSASSSSSSCRSRSSRQSRRSRRARS